MNTYCSQEQRTAIFEKETEQDCFASSLPKVVNAGRTGRGRWGLPASAELSGERLGYGMGGTPPVNPGPRLASLSLESCHVRALG